jgi:hypothetical protein
LGGNEDREADYLLGLADGSSAPMTSGDDDDEGGDDAPGGEGD